MTRVLLLILTVNMLMSIFLHDIKIVKAEAWTGGTIFIEADGSIRPENAPVKMVGNTYFLTSDIITPSHGVTLVVKKSNITVDGNGHSLRGTPESVGICLDHTSNVVIKNVKIEKFEEGITLLYANSSVIRENEIIESPIEVHNSSNVLIFKNVIHSGGIFIFSLSSNNNVTENIIKNGSIGLRGIRLESARVGSWVGNNYIVKNKLENGIISIGSYNDYDIMHAYVIGNYGVGTIEIGGASNNIIIGNRLIKGSIYIKMPSPYVLNKFYSYIAKNNTISDNTVNGKPIVYLEGMSNCKINAVDAGQVILSECSNITIENLNICDTEVGILLWKTNTSKVIGNLLTNSKIGLLLSFNNNLVKNEIINGTIFLDSSKNNIVRNSNIMGSIRLGGSHNNTIIRNNIINGDVYTCALGLDWSLNNVIIGNNISSEGTGIDFHHSSNNLIAVNNIMDNRRIGVFVYSSSNNSFLNNNFINNKLAVDIYKPFDVINPDYVPSVGNCWIKNYWDDYTGEDTNGDGIGDVQYIINEDNKDDFPLINPFAINDGEHFILVSSRWGDTFGTGWYETNSEATISIFPTRIEIDFFTEYVFEGWKVDRKMISTSPTYTFIVTRSMVFIASWRTRINLARIGVIIGIIMLILISIMFLKLKKQS